MTDFVTRDGGTQITRWWRPTPNRQATTMGFARWLFVLGIFTGWGIDRLLGIS